MAERTPFMRKIPPVERVFIQKSRKWPNLSPRLWDDGREQRMESQRAAVNVTDGNAHPT